MQQKTLLKRLSFAYKSAVLIIGVLIILAQVIIQVTLYQEVQTRNLASTMSLQELRVQALFRDSLLALVPPSTLASYNPLKVSPFDQFKQLLTKVEQTHNYLISTAVPTRTRQQILAVDGDFQQMDQAAHTFIAALQAKNEKAAGKQVGILFISEQKDLQGVYSAYMDLTAQADQYVMTVRIIEATICVVSLAVLIYEALVIIRPVLNDQVSSEKQLEDARKKAVSAEQDKTASDEEKK